MNQKNIISITETIDLALPGCSLTPMSNYLKSLGLIRIVDESKGYWKDGRFYLQSGYSQSELIKKIPDGYVASPICTPWNGSCGLYEKMPIRLDLLLKSPNERWKYLQNAYRKSQQVIQSQGLKSQPTGKKKIEFIKIIRSYADEQNRWQLWLDIVAVSKTTENSKGKLEEGFIYPGISGGTGGSVGNKDLGAVYLEALECVYNLNSGKPLPQGETLLESSLFGTSREGTLAPLTLLTQFSPVNDYYRDISGAKAHSEYAESGGGSTSMGNPWDVILLFEGLLTLSGFSAKKINQQDNDERTQANFSLAVDLASGTADITTKNETSRPLEEIWLPVWEEPLSSKNLRRIFDDMGNRLPNQQLSDSIDFAHTISRLGKEQSFSSFVRYSFLPRKGRVNFAICLGGITLKSDSLRDDLASQLRTFRRSCYVIANDKYSTTTICMVVRQLDQELMELARGSGSYLQCLILLGKLAIAISRSNIIDITEYIPVPPFLSAKWLDTILQQEQSTECRLGVSLASLSFRQRATKLAWNTKGNRFYWNKEQTPIWGRGNLCRNLIALQRQWQIDLSQGTQPFGKFLTSPSFQDLTNFIEGRVDEQKIEQIAIGASLCQQVSRVFDGEDQGGFLPPHYSLSALSHWSLDSGEKPRLEAIEVVNLLARKESERAMSLAIRKLQSKSLFPLFVNTFKHPRSVRIAAALAFSISKDQLHSISKHYLKSCQEV